MVQGTYAIVNLQVHGNNFSQSNDENIMLKWTQ